MRSTRKIDLPFADGRAKNGQTARRLGSARPQFDAETGFDPLLTQAASSIRA